MINSQGVIVAIGESGAWIPGVDVASGGGSQDGDGLQVVDVAALESNSHGLREEWQSATWIWFAREEGSPIHRLPNIEG